MNNEMQLMVEGEREAKMPVKLVNVTAWFSFGRWLDLDATAKKNPEVRFMTNSRDQLYGMIDINKGENRHGKVLIVKSGMYFTGKLPPVEIHKEIDSLFNSIKWVYI